MSRISFVSSVNIKFFVLCIFLNLVLIGCTSGSDWEKKHPEKDYFYNETDQEDISAGNLFYVAKNGNDDNPGTELQPWLTIQKAADTLGPGQKVYIKEGVYNEQVLITKSGSEDNYIIFSAYPSHQVIIDGINIKKPDGSFWGGLFYIKKANYVKIKGFKVRNSTMSGILTESVDHIVIKDNYTYNTFSSGIGTWFSTNVLVDGNEVVWACHQGTQECISVAGCSRFEVKNNHVHHSGDPKNGGEGIDGKHSVEGTIHHNLVHDLGRVGIYVDAWDFHEQDIEVFNNVIYHCRDWGLACAAENGGILENIKVYNNVIYNNGAVGIGIESWGVDGAHHYFRNIYIYNNTIYNNQYSKGNRGAGIHINIPEGENIFIINNICYKNNIDNVSIETAPKNLIVENNFEGEDPLFANPGKYDFHLKGDSPAIDRATSTNVPNSDFDGNSRPEGTGYDIGAFEFLKE